jgi:serine phosphatase RsbU (regulator of sigma subunit)
MGRVRSSLRAYALEDDDPALVLTKLDRKLQHFEPGHLATVLYALLDPEARTAVISSAGHLPPILVSSPGEAERLEIPVAPPIGVPSHIERRARTVQLRSGAVICLYTDGMVERRTRDLDAELLRLQSALAAVPLTSAESACVQAMGEMLGDRESEDDISLLAMRLHDPT